MREGMPRRRRLGDNTGGVRLRIVLAVATLVAVGAAVMVLLDAHQSRQRVHHRKAVELSEEGLMIALEELRRQPSRADGIPRTDHRGGWYEVRFHTERVGDTLMLKAVARGGSGSVVREKAMSLRLDTADGDSVWVPLHMR